MKARLLLFLISACFLLQSYGQDAAVIQKLCRDVKIIPSKNVGSFDYKYDFDQKTRIITVFCTKQIDNDLLRYVIKLKDFKHIFKKETFSVGDTYQYLESYFMINGLKVSLANQQSVNNSGNLLAQISDVWTVYHNHPHIKRIIIGDRTIYLIEGTDPFCNGHGCSDFVVYFLQKQNKKISVNSLYFESDSSPYDFNNVKLFFDKDNKDPELFVPGYRRVKSAADLDRVIVRLYWLNFIPWHDRIIPCRELTNSNRQNFVLSINQRRISKPQDTIIKNKKCTYINVPLWLSNYSKDTLKFVSMSCSWYLFYHIQGENLGIATDGICNSNFPIEKIIPPYKSIKWMMPISLSKNYQRNEKFRIGMNLYLSQGLNQNILRQLNHSFNLLWSNEVQIP
jgi:hypothetical protein